MYHFVCRPSNSVALLVAVGRADYIVVPRSCIIVVLGIVLSGATGMLLVGNASVRSSVAAASL